MEIALHFTLHIIGCKVTALFLFTKGLKFAISPILMS